MKMVDVFFFQDVPRYRTFVTAQDPETLLKKVSADLAEVLDKPQSGHKIRVAKYTPCFVVPKEE